MGGNLNFLGKDSGFGRLNTSAWMECNGRFILIDCGYTVFPELQRKDLLNKGYDGFDVIITHLHPDHVGSLGQLAFYTYFAFKKPINIISSCENLELLMEITGASKDYTVPGYPEMMYTRENHYQIKFIKTVHVSNMDCYGFYGEFGKKRVVYTGDTSTLEPFISYTNPNTEFYVEASVLGGVHLDVSANLELLKFIAEHSAGLYLMHLDDESKIAEIIKGTKIRSVEVTE